MPIGVGGWEGLLLKRWQTRVESAQCFGTFGPNKNVAYESWDDTPRSIPGFIYLWRFGLPYIMLPCDTSPPVVDSSSSPVKRAIRCQNCRYGVDVKVVSEPGYFVRTK